MMPMFDLELDSTPDSVFLLIESLTLKKKKIPVLQNCLHRHFITFTLNSLKSI